MSNQTPQLNEAEVAVGAYIAQRINDFTAWLKASTVIRRDTYESAEPPIPVIQWPAHEMEMRLTAAVMDILEFVSRNSGGIKVPLSAEQTGALLRAKEGVSVLLASVDQRVLHEPIATGIDIDTLVGLVEERYSAAEGATNNDGWVSVIERADERQASNRNSNVEGTLNSAAQAAVVDAIACSMPDSLAEEQSGVEDTDDDDYSIDLDNDSDDAGAIDTGADLDQRLLADITATTNGGPGDVRFDAAVRAARNTLALGPGEYTGVEPGDYDLTEEQRTEVARAAILAVEYTGATDFDNGNAIRRSMGYGVPLPIVHASRRQLSRIGLPIPGMSVPWGTDVLPPARDWTAVTDVLSLSRLDTARMVWRAAVADGVPPFIYTSLIDSALSGAPMSLDFLQSCLKAAITGQRDDAELADRTPERELEMQTIFGQAMVLRGMYSSVEEFLAEAKDKGPIPLSEFKKAEEYLATQAAAGVVATNASGNYL